MSPTYYVNRADGPIMGHMWEVVSANDRIYG